MKADFLNNFHIIPGVYDALSAKIAAQQNFKYVVLTGYSVSATLIGEPDIGLMTQTEVVECARRITNASDSNLIVDGDNGHGNVLNVKRLIQDLKRVGVFGVLLEDQVWPKKCGHMPGKQIVTTTEHQNKLKAAKDTAGDDLFIIARTDARSIEGFKSAIDRANQYLEAGADCVFVEALETIAELEETPSLVNGKVITNFVPNGKTPIIGFNELEEHGYLGVLCPLNALFYSAFGIQEAFRQLKEGHFTFPENFGFAEFNDLIGLKEKESLLKEYM